MAHHHQAWCRLRRLGRLRFVLLYGVLGWGLPLGLIFSVVFATLIGLANAHGPSDSEIMPWAVPLGLVEGIGFGGWTWVLGEQGHRRWLERAEGQRSACRVPDVGIADEWEQERPLVGRSSVRRPGPICMP